MKWEILKEETKDHWLEVVTENGYKHAVCKWDGCVDLRSYVNGYEHGHKCGENCRCYADYIHVCNLDDYIKELQKLSKKAKEFYKGNQGEENWNEN